MQKKNKHTFAICAYGESPYLGACVKSLKRQSVSSTLLMATSTPNDHIKRICAHYQIPLFVNDGERGIAQDWNFAYGKADTPYVTIAHQDDIYHKKYTECLCKFMDGAKRPLMFFSDYGEIRNGKIVVDNTLLRVKRLMLIPLKWRRTASSRWIRRRILSLGSPVCCPSAGFAKANIQTPVFEAGFQSNLDWQAWEKISREKGEFLYCGKRLLYHRIHEGSQTTRVIGESGRKEEDMEMFGKFWPGWAARLLTGLYGRSEGSNQI